MKPHDNLLSEIASLYERYELLSDFAPLPEDLIPQQVIAHERQASLMLQAEDKLKSASHAALQEALIAASPDMHWREVYTQDEASPVHVSYEFMSRLGVYAIIGKTGPFASSELSLYMVYMPAGLTYPWHYHPAEELYFILSGEAVFRRQGHEDRLMREGDVIVHETNQPHEMQTYDKACLSLAVWRNHLDIAPTLMAK